MSNTTLRPALEASPIPGDRLEIHVRLPAVPLEHAPLAEPSNGASEPTRGMQVLNGILDKRSRGGWPRPSGRRVANRLWLVAMALVGLSCFALIYGLTNDVGTVIESENTDVFADGPSDDFESDSGRGPSATHGQRPRSASDLNAATESEQPRDSVVHAAVYQTTRPSAARPVWLEGTIDPDDSPIP